ncbi:MAG: YceI family protein [Pseudomonadota bacterium]
MKNLLVAALLLPTTLAAEQREWTLDLGHAHIGWEIGHMGLSNTVGRFERFDGTFLIDEQDPANSAITFEIEVPSIDSNHRGRDEHLRSADYFDASNHPTITFASTRIDMLTPTTGKLTGDLTMRGQTAPVTLDFQLVRDRRYPDFIPGYDEIRVVGFEARGEVLRLDHGMDFIAFLDSPTGLVASVDIKLDLVDCEGVPQTNVPCTYGR